MIEQVCFEIIWTGIEVMFNYLRFEYFYACFLLKKQPCKLHGYMICQPCNDQQQLCSGRWAAHILSSDP